LVEAVFDIQKYECYYVCMAQSAGSYRALPTRTVREAAERLRLLGHPLRLRILERLLHEAATVSELAQSLHQPQAVISQHLALLRLHRLVARRRSGKMVTYRIADRDPAEILGWVHRRRYNNESVQGGEAI